MIGYAGFYIAKYDISAEDVTLTIFRGAKPEKMFSEMTDFVEADETKGIYHIKDWKVDFPIQIVITTELEGKEYAGFRAISKKTKLEDIQQIIHEVIESEDPKLMGWYHDYFDQFSKLDSEMIEIAKRSILKWLRHGEIFLNPRLMSGLGMRWTIPHAPIYTLMYRMAIWR